MSSPQPSGRPTVIGSLLLLVASGVVAQVGCVSIDDRPTVEAGASGQGQGGTGGSNGGSSAKGGGSGKGGSGNGGTGATGGSGGTGKGGTGGTGGASAAGGTGGTSGKGGTGGSAGTGGGSNVECGDDVSPTAARVRACVYSLSCNPFQPVWTLSQCVSLGVYRGCEATATSCEDIEQCVGVRREPASVCDTDETGWKCDGDVAINCEFSYSVDCGRLGTTCDLFESTTVNPARWPCRMSAPASCTGDEAMSVCSGSSVYSCVDGKPYGMNCTRWGYNCLEITPGQAYCTDRVVSCDEPAGAVSCSGNSIQLCDAAGRFGSYDCTPAGATCFVDAAGGWCLSPGCDTEEAAECEEQCLDDTSLQVCVGGAPLELDCTDYDFDRCVTYENHPSSGKPYVECYSDVAE